MNYLRESSILLLYHQIREKCLKNYQKLRSWLRFFPLRMHVKLRHQKLNLKRLTAKFRQIPVVIRDVLISPSAETKILTTRTRIGVCFILFSPLIKVLYKVFPEPGFGEYLVQTSWLTIPNTIEPNLPEHFFSLHYWMWSNAEIWWTVWAFLGVYLMTDKKEAKTLIVVLITYSTMHGINRLVSSDLMEFHSLVNILIYFPLVFLAIFFLVKVLDKALFEKHHGKEISNEKRIMGIINLPNVTWKEKTILLRKVVNPSECTESVHT